MKTLNRVMGQKAEDMAVGALTEKGFTIIERNFANRFGEIDIIAKERDILVFVEVKAKTEDSFGLPEEMINGRKLEKVRRMAIIYTKGNIPLCRIDIVTVILSAAGKLLRLTHYENVY